MKYTYEFANLKETVYDNILKYLLKISSHFKEILEEIYNHRDLAIIWIKQAIDEKTKTIMKIAIHSHGTLQPTIYKHEISIQEQLESPKPPNFNNFPRPVD